MNTKAFTLVEIAIVLLIISLLIGGVLTGRTMLNQAKITQIITEAGKITRAVESFQEIYKQLPGDMFNPDTVFSANAINGDPSTTRGNGNDIIDNNEGIFAFQHLALSGILQGNFNGTWTYNNMYKGPIANTAFYFVNAFNERIVLRFAKINYINANTPVAFANDRSFAALSLEDMLQLDRKFDDGIANTGNIRASNGTDPSLPNNCIDGTGNYNLVEIGNESQVCFFDLRMDRSLFNLN